MKQLICLVLAILSALTVVIDVSAQSSESIWLTANTTAYKTGETVLVTLHASSATPIQGFTFQIRYDPSCLQPVNASSPVSGMNGLPLPQLSGLVDGSYASTASQTVSGILAEVQFTALKGCQTSLTLESAALAIRNAEGFAVPLDGVLIGERSLSLNIDRQVAALQPAQVEPSGSILPLAPSKVEPAIPLWMMVAFAILAASLMFGTLLMFRKQTVPNRKASNRSARRVANAVLHMKHGPQAGKSFSLSKAQILIGRDPQGDICVNDPHIINHHAQIYLNGNGYFLRDLGGRTFVNGHPVKSSAIALHPGDVVRLGKSVLFVFG